ncbi:MAG TPA: 2-C-methyl-D-erythritol 4-phosphate cytidylyltransferase [Candidatus Dormibacteraeota bacterium]|jgi:2-C-methyl-D-erythritol 4-phosphate cytidylyltransferase
MSIAPVERTVALIPLPSSRQGRDGLRLTIQGRSILDWTVDAIDQVPEIASLVFSCQQPGWASLHDAAGASGKARYVGEPASGWVAALRRALDVAPASDRVLMQQPNRPLTSAAGLRSFLLAAKGQPAAAVVLPVKSTYKKVVDGRVCGTVPRDQLFQLQHTLVVDRRRLEDAVDAALRNGWDGADEFALCQWAAIPIGLVRGSYFNLPVVRRTDVEFAELTMAQHAQPAV